ncbi:MAG: family N-acetyltransferase [Hydrocarboniphaga sp.]|uniref:GNAT family N-acetyltransferase n=1 Tax=Hydrocarboniphaga sp. TaxID=2033016 RepID=UPI0026210AF7|nr:GNAT family N-acetyltransferase [Hydrocarboniphaga sp.]MDB5968874.1 family N-acetyltransferase [Hydrocarboniphaga sp.]
MGAAATVRRAALADIDALLKLEALFPSDQMSRRSLRGFVANPRADFLVAETGGRVLGNLLLLSRAGSRTARIYSVMVDPWARGLGLAQQLVAAAEAAARRRHCTSIALEVRADNIPARRLYEKLGYTVDRELPAYYDDSADGLRLKRRLEPDDG